MDLFIKEIIFIIILITATAMVYGMYLVERNINYLFSSEEKVQAEICKQVKPEYLINKCD